MILKQLGPCTIELGGSGFWTLEEPSTSVPKVHIKRDQYGVLLPKSVWQTAIHGFLHFVFERHGGRAMITKIDCANGLLSSLEFVDIR